MYNGSMWDDDSSLSGTNVSINSSSNIIIVNNLSNYITSESVEDEDFLDLESSKSGYGIVQAGDNEEYGVFTFTSAGVVTLLTDSTANVVNTDTDTKLCIFDNGTNVRIKNRLGSAKILRVSVSYS